MQSRKFLRVASPIIIGTILLSFAYLATYHRPPAVSGESGETTYYLLTDHLGSVDVVLDEAGNVVERRDYLPYGAERAQETFNGVPITDLGFTGKELDDETGLNYYGARYYDPVTGRFIQMDPLLLGLDKMTQEQRNAFLSNPENLNTYSYVTNNPIRFTDPTGMYGMDIHYSMTYYLGQKSGLAHDDAKQIAEFDQYTDVNPDTKPGSSENANNGNLVKYHFQTWGDALANVKEKINTGDLQDFGTALHTFQDTYSHYKLYPFAHLIKDVLPSTHPDYTSNDPEKAMRMARATFGLLRLYNAKQNGMGGLSVEEYDAQSEEIWGTIKSDVEEFMKAKQGDKSNTSVLKQTIEIDEAK